MRLWQAVCVCLVAPLAACDRIPGTDAYQIREAEKSAADQLIDPTSAQFRNVVVQGITVCGEINGKNRMGAYAGFTRFMSTKGVSQAILDPEADPNDAASAADLCASARSNEYSSAYLTQSSCQRAEEEQAKQVLQQAFDSSWKAMCEK
jgi:hypothetical protein